jgi:hypothetical protein
MGSERKETKCFWKTSRVLRSQYIEVYIDVQGVPNQIWEFPP